MATTSSCQEMSFMSVYTCHKLQLSRAERSKNYLRVICRSCPWYAQLTTKPLVLNNGWEADAEARRNQLMKDMAQLRLQAEVSQLEGSLQSSEKPSLPPYLVPDATVLCYNLNIVKQLANSARFIIIIPIAVIDHLDILKKETVGARDAIRWLEAEFHKGNRYVRAQKNHEKVTTIPHKNLKKRDKDAWRIVQIVDCCKYLGQQSSECETKGLVSILSNLTAADPKLSLRVKQTLQSAQQEGVGLQNALEFHGKWKEIWKGGRG